jgi:Flp pilus assembly protein TadG
MKILKASNRGQGLTEFALILPILLLFVFLIIDLSRAAYFYSVVFNSAREGARYAVARPGASPGAIIDAAKRLAAGVDVSVSIPVTTDDRIEVEVSYTFRPATPILWDLIGNGSIELRNKATMQIEQ